MKKKIIIGAFALGLGLFAFTSNIVGQNHQLMDSGSSKDLYTDGNGTFCCAGSYDNNCQAADCKK